MISDKALGTLQRSELYRDLLDTLPDAAVIINREGRIVIVNKQAESLFGYLREEILEQPVEVLMAHRLRDGHRRNRDGFLANPHTRAMGSGLDLTGMRKDGTEFPVEVSLSRLKVEEQFFVSAIIRDISDRKKVEAKMLRLNADLTCSNAELDQFAAIAAHDLREPLRTITSFTQLLEKRLGAELDDRSRKYMAHVNGGTKRMQDLIQAILDYSSVGHQGIKADLVDAEAATRRALQNLERQIQDMGATIECATMPFVHADAVLLEQLLQNLVSNALKFMAKSRPAMVTIRARESVKEWILSVADNGIGIRPADIERIFILFQRVHSATEYPGTGIGLATCKKIVERHGGRLWVESTIDVGTTFFFSLPKS